MQFFETEMEKWAEGVGTFYPKPINRKKYSFLWPNFEFNIEVNIELLLSVVSENKAMTFG